MEPQRHLAAATTLKQINPGSAGVNKTSIVMSVILNKVDQLGT